MRSPLMTLVGHFSQFSSFPLPVRIALLCWPLATWDQGPHLPNTMPYSDRKQMFIKYFRQYHQNRGEQNNCIISLLLHWVFGGFLFAMQLIGSQIPTRNCTQATAMKIQDPNHQATREFPTSPLLWTTLLTAFYENNKFLHYFSDSLVWCI